MKGIIKINAKSREEVGKKIAKKIRKEGEIPAIIYGGGIESIPITMKLDDIKEILKSEKGENTILKITRDKKIVDAMLKDIQYDYLSDNIIHADFIRINMEKLIEVDIPVVIKGESIGVKVEEGIFDFVTRELRIRSLPADIPKEIEVDISDLHIGHSIKVGNIKVGEGIALFSDPDTVICSVSTKVAEKEEVVEEEVEEVVEEEVAGDDVEKEEGKEIKKEEKKVE
jgi:large subunit ribosomal protein L25